MLRHVLAALSAGNAPLDPDDAEVTVGLGRLRRDCVEAKEALSTDVDTLVPVALPGLSTTVRITRAEFELMIRPALTETIAAMSRALRNAHVEPSQLRSILLVGGSSRIPLVSEMLHREFSVPTALDTHPKHDVALGSVRVGQEETDALAAAPDQAAPPPTEAAAPRPSSRSRPHSRAPRPRRCPRRPTSPRRLLNRRDAPTAPLPVAGTAPPRLPGRRRWPSATADRRGGRHRLGRPPAASPPAEAAGDGPRRSGRVRVLAVVLAAVLLGVGAGVFIALRDRATVASPPVTSAPPSIAPVVGTGVPVGGDPDPGPVRHPDAVEQAGPVRRAARVRAAGRRGHRLASRPGRATGTSPCWTCGRRRRLG